MCGACRDIGVTEFSMAQESSKAKGIPTKKGFKISSRMSR
jgi:hypothetical protein